MAKKPKADPSKIFISYAWESQPVARKLQQALLNAGAEVFVDDTRSKGGASLPARVSQALCWCDTVVLLWSKDAAVSRCVEPEWTSAIALHRRLIPCMLDGSSLPEILMGMRCVEFKCFEQGFDELLAALGRKLPVAIPASPAPLPPLVPNLRAQPLDQLTLDDAKKMLQEKNFFDVTWNKQGQGLRHEYKTIEHHGQALVIDHATGLTWQQSGSEAWREYHQAQAYVSRPNGEYFGGFSDWRLPTLEEAMSLMEPKKQGELYIDQVFDSRQRWIWTADKSNGGVGWVVHFDVGGCSHSGVHSYNYVRAVR